MRQDVVARAFSFFGEKALDDDVTVVVAELTKEWRRKPETPQDQAAIEIDAAPPSTPEEAGAANMAPAFDLEITVSRLAPAGPAAPAFAADPDTSATAVPIVESLVFECESRMIEPQQVQKRGVEIGDGDGIGDGLVSEVVRRAVHDTGLDAATSHPKGEAISVVVTAKAGLAALGDEAL